MKHSDRELVQMAISNTKPLFESVKRQKLVEFTFGVDADESRLICWKYGFDPDKEIEPLV